MRSWRQPVARATISERTPRRPGPRDSGRGSLRRLFEVLHPQVCQLAFIGLSEALPKRFGNVRTSQGPGFQLVIESGKLVPLPRRQGFDLFNQVGCVHAGKLLEWAPAASRNGPSSRRGKLLNFDDLLIEACGYGFARLDDEKLLGGPRSVHQPLKQTEVARDFLELPALVGAEALNLLAQAEGLGEIELDQRAVMVALRPAAHDFEEILRLFLAEFLHPRLIGRLGGGLEVGRHEGVALRQRFLAAPPGALQPAGRVVVSAGMRVKEFLVALLRAEKERDAVVGARHHQRGVRAAETRQDVAAQAVADQNRVVFAGGGGIDAPLDFGATGPRDVVVALGQELEVEQV